eukprot:TRINITY_DN106053_c0_g1_i1.p1 TRINITY_DN106053_c0_g1~~TRINITY_DN106053_c0_g1_i1.p1  ORF type:complete len:1028 (+),score=257.80 TRINITY_DN106053_c0_g1_i1:79-3162(+)
MAPQEERYLTHSASEARQCTAEAIPAAWPYSRVINNKVHPYPEQSLEAASHVLERTVTPEAHRYFTRIVQVAQSELEKLLIHKVQHIFDPVRAESLKDSPLQGVPDGFADSRMKLLEKGRHGLGRLRSHDPTNSKAKSIVEGQQLTAYVVTVLSRIMVDFSRFADTVLRWQREPAGLTDHFKRKEPGEEAPVGGKSDRNGFFEFDDVVQRLERQDKLNTELENKYSNILAELRERKRQFLRERAVFKERLRLLSVHARETGDGKLAQLLTHDVQFYEEGGMSIEDLKDQYERKLAEQKKAYEDKVQQRDADIITLKQDVAGLNATIEDLKNRKKVDPLAAKVEKLERALEEADEALRKALEENATLKVANDGLIMQVESLKAALEAKTKELHQAREAAELAEGKLKDLERQVAELQKKLEVAQKHAKATQAKPTLVRQVLRGLTVSIEPEPPDDRLEQAEKALRESRAKVEELSAEVARLQEALDAAASRSIPTPETATTTCQTDLWEPNKKELEEALAREAALRAELAALRAEVDELVRQAALAGAAPEKAATRDIGVGTPPVVKQEKKEVQQEEPLQEQLSDITEVQSSAPPPPPPPPEKVDWGPPGPPAMTEKELRMMFEYPRVRTLGGGWLQALDRSGRSKSPGASFGGNAEGHPQSRSPDHVPFPEETDPRPGSPQQPIWPKKQMPPELVSSGLGRGRSPSPPLDMPTPSPLPLAVKAKRSTVCGSPPPRWPAESRSKSPGAPPRERSPLVPEATSDSKDVGVSMSEVYTETELMSSGDLWRRGTYRSGHPLGGSATLEAPRLPEPNIDASFVLSGERPPSALAAARAYAEASMAAAGVHPPSNPPALGRQQCATSPSRASEAEDRTKSPPRPSGSPPPERPAVANIDMMSFATTLPEMSAGRDVFNRRHSEVRSSYGGGFIVASAEGGSKRQAARSGGPVSQASRGRDETMRRAASGPCLGTTDSGRAGNRPGSATKQLRPTSASNQGRLRRGLSRPTSAAKLPEVGRNTSAVKPPWPQSG